MAIQNKLPLFRKMYAFTIVMHRALRNMPREHRYTLGSETAQICWNCLDFITGTSVLPKDRREKKIFELSVEFDRLSLRLRAMQELNIISAGQYAHWQENYLFEIGKQIGGWLKWAKNKN